MNTSENWLSMAEMNPNQWAEKQGPTVIINEGAKSTKILCQVEGLRFKVKLQDGRYMYSWWEGNGWSLERLKPHLKVTHWVKPVIK